jgi:hypothetical protein
MRMLLAVAALLIPLQVADPAFATDPGTPMDCSDLELAPGLSCTRVDGPIMEVSSQNVLDNDGRLIRVGKGSNDDDLETIGSCGSSRLQRSALLWLNDVDGSSEPIVSVRWRCLDAAASRFEYARFGAVLFHAVPGSVLVGATSNCGPDAATCPYLTTPWTARIDGFTPLGEVLPAPQPLCGNGIDDDRDGRTDAADSDCKSTADNDESRP